MWSQKTSKSKFFDITSQHVKLRLKCPLIFSVLTKDLVPFQVPQLIFQALYATESGFTRNVMFASVASLLSVIAAILSHFIDRDHHSAETIAVHYYLSLECHRTEIPETQEGGTRNTKSPPTLSSRQSSKSVNAITAEERANMLNYAGLRWKMSGALARLWHIPQKAVEIGATVLTESGAITHIVHLMKRDAVDIYAAELFGDQHVDYVTPIVIARRFYEIRKLEISEIFRAHFDLSNAFFVAFSCRIEKKKRAVSVENGMKRRNGFVDGTTSEDLVTDSDVQLKRALRVFFNDQRGGSIWMKRAKAIRLMDDVNRPHARWSLPPSMGTKQRTEGIQLEAVNSDSDRAAKNAKDSVTMSLGSLNLDHGDLDIDDLFDGDVQVSATED